MTLRRPAAHLRKPPAWRRSEYESNWESLMAEEGEFSSIYRPPRAARPQSAIEGGQLDSWLKHLQRMQNELLRVQDQVPVLKEPTGHGCKQTFSGSSSSCGSPRLQSSYGSQESLQTGQLSPPERQGSWEKARITQVGKREQAQLSCIAPVKIGWLPIQRRVTVAADSKHRHFLDNSASQVKLKQPITPTIQTNQVTANSRKDDEVERRQRALKEGGVKTQQTPDRDPPVTPQVPEKRSFLANVVSRSVSWQALRRGWNANRGSAVPGGSQASQLPTGTNRKFPLMTTNSPQPDECAACGTTSADPCKSHLQGTDRPSTPSGVQLVRATAPAYRTGSSSEPSHAQRSSAVTTIIPQNKAGISSITISSRKVSRSESFSGTDTNKPSPSPQHARNQAMDSSPGQFTVQRRATIVKVTERRVMSSPAPSTEGARAPPAHQVVDTVVHRRKATIIKVTERRESYGGSKGGPESRPKHPEYRHSFAGDHQPSHNAAPSYQGSTKLSDTAPEPNRSTASIGGGMLHRSTLSLIVSSPPAIAAAPPSQPSLRAAGQSSRRQQRPASCYGDVCGYAEARRRSSELAREAQTAPVHPSGGPISPPADAKAAGQLVASTFEPNGGDTERSRAETEERRMSPSLTLIKAPDLQSSQSPEEVLALNAAAIIANIKLQRQLSRRTSVPSETDSSARPQGTSADGQRPDGREPQQQNQPHAAFGPEPWSCSLQEALQRSRPDFITRSQGRLRELERRRLERRELGGSSAGAGRRRVHRGRPAPPPPPPHNDNLFKPGDRATRGKEMPLRSKRTVAEVRKKEEERKKELCLSNRQRMELFKKRLLDQILQRNNS
ncbi:(E2-independent) E3 ubiquitin-conjugating enzyme FATS [Takifugu rubripes]|uniref:(E2-independent) E3 ubiquitin-conjugating enzyme FATS n=1 Tax=Takifugu rubripes TaxID=31033 RepID=UPI0011455EBA|nr:(E2-independent) E3 ubiquitin-conjugating enzyme FATS [Takifugu rubripes]XP_029702363.1 (E2-independent) E3 ubiquitin-conjugating enzyme FATS [Takifugu rubripes]